MKKMIILVMTTMGFGAFAGGGSSIGPGNPAAINCEKLGGVLEVEQTPAGNGTNCVIEEWALWKAMDERGLLGGDSNPRPSLANPAAVNCERIGGQVRFVETPEGQAGHCVVEEWTLLRAINVVEEP